MLRVCPFHQVKSCFRNDIASVQLEGARSPLKLRRTMAEASAPVQCRFGLPSLAPRWSRNGRDQVLDLTGAFMLGKTAQPLGLAERTPQGAVRHPPRRGRARDGIEVEAVAADLAGEAQPDRSACRWCLGGGEFGLVDPDHLARVGAYGGQRGSGQLGLQALMQGGRGGSSAEAGVGVEIRQAFAPGPAPARAASRSADQCRPRHQGRPHIARRRLSSGLPARSMRRAAGVCQSLVHPLRTPARGSRCLRHGVHVLGAPKPVATWSGAGQRKTPKAAVTKRPSGLMRRGGIASIATPKAPSSPFRRAGPPTRRRASGRRDRRANRRSPPPAARSHRPRPCPAPIE